MNIKSAGFAALLAIHGLCFVQPAIADVITTFTVSDGGLGGGSITPVPTVTGSFDFDTSNPSLLAASNSTLAITGSQ